MFEETKPNVAASENGRNTGNEIEFCYHWVQFLTKCWSTFYTVVLKITLHPPRTYMYMIYHELGPISCPKFLWMVKFFQLGGFIPVASQLQLLKLLENMVNCSLDNLEIIYYKRPLGEICDSKNWKSYWVLKTASSKTVTLTLRSCRGWRWCCVNDIGTK